jgi:hypothetical protein
MVLASMPSSHLRVFEAECYPFLWAIGGPKMQQGKQDSSVVDQIFSRFIHNIKLSRGMEVSRLEQRGLRLVSGTLNTD